MKEKKRRKDVPRAPLEWRESRTVRNQDELRAGDEVQATLRWEGWGSTYATGTARAGRWTFARPRLLSHDVSIWVAGREDGAPFAVFAPRLAGDGALTCADGRAYYWEPTDFWRTQWRLTGANGRALLHAGDTSSFWERRTGIWLAPGAGGDSGADERERALLVLAARYLMVLQAQDAAAVAAVTTAAVT
ncbi:MAG: hypothetical protein JXA09_10365 [Anaerolineae bacterium]|nr:hypothetical protein [Anaerolineae bacterium]